MLLLFFICIFKFFQFYPDSADIFDVAFYSFSYKQIIKQSSVFVVFLQLDSDLLDS